MTPTELIKHFEGCKLKAYQDSGGVWTIGYGSVGPGISAGVVWEQWQADERFAEDVAKFEAGVRALIKVPITSNQLSALTSFAYNVGLGNFSRSGALKALNRQDYKGAAANLLLWNKVGSYVVPGLVNRRQQEHDLFLLPDPVSK